jgi:Right handed beta helix region
MSKHLVKFLVALSALLLSATPAMAQATRTWVSGVGDDANPCSRTAPCKTFAGSISKTAAGGEINVLDPGGFGAVTITKSITIRSDSIEAGILVSGTNGVVINAGAGDRVILEGLDFEGLNTGLSGVNVLQAREVVVRKSTIRNFTVAGITLNSASKVRLVVEDSSFIGNTLGIQVIAATGNNSAKVNSSSFVSNATTGVRVTGATNSALLNANQFFGSAKGLELLSGGTATSYGNNVFDTLANDAPTLVPLG